MTIIHIKKIQNPSSGIESYAVPCMAIVTPDGRRLIPNPSGKEAELFTTLQDAESAILRAGFDSEFEGHTKRNLPQPSGPLAPRTVLTGRPLEDSIPRLIELLSDKEAQVIANAALALGALKAQPAIEGLIGVLGHDEPTVRKNAAEALARIGAFTLNALRDTLGKARVVSHSNSLYIRLSVLTAYSEMIQLKMDLTLVNNFLPQVADCLKDDSWLVRSQAAYVMAQAAIAMERSH